MDNALLEKIKNAGQLQILRFYDELSEAEKNAFDAQLDAVNWHSLPELAENYVLKRPETAIPDDLAPAKYFPLDPPDSATAELYERADAEMGLQQSKRDQIINIYLGMFSFLIPFAISLKLSLS